MTATQAALFDGATPSADPLPNWLLEQLYAHGLTPTRGERQPHERINGNATARWCTRCGTPVYTGYELHGLAVRLEVAPTTAGGEAFALLTGRHTWTVTEIHRDIHRRRARDIERDNPDQVRVHVDHQCHGPPLPANETWRKPPRDNYTEPPF